MKKLVNLILIFMSGFIILTMGILYGLYRNQQPTTLGCGTKAPPFICGTNSAQWTENAKMGRKVFNTHCAACHQLHKKMTGPALAKTDSTLFYHWMTLRDGTADTTKYSNYGVDFHRIIGSKYISSEELQGLYEYVNAE